MSKLGKLFRITCAIINIILGMAYMMYSLDHKKPIMVVVSAAIIAINYWWITNFMGNKEEAPNGTITESIKSSLESLAEYTNIEGVDVEIDEHICSIDILNKLKPEIEQKYDVTIITEDNRRYIKPNGNYKSEYWN